MLKIGRKLRVHNLVQKLLKPGLLDQDSCTKNNGLSQRNVLGFIHFDELLSVSRYECFYLKNANIHIFSTHLRHRHLNEPHDFPRFQVLIVWYELGLSLECKYIAFKCDLCTVLMILLKLHVFEFSGNRMLDP